jgi:hypothetical protein
VGRARFDLPDGKGRSGGYRVIAFYAGARPPVFLLPLYAKGDRADLSKASAMSCG